MSETARPLTPGQLKLVEWFRVQAPSLGELYEGSLRMLVTKPPGHVRFISHAVREIRNALPRIVGGVRVRGRLDYAARLDTIAAALDRAGLTAHRFVGGDFEAATSEIEVPAEIILQVVQLSIDHQLARQKPLDAARLLFEALAPENSVAPELLTPALRHWKDVTDWFMNRAHDGGACDAATEPDVLARQFDQFELTLISLVGGFYEVVGDLDDILEDANS